MRVFAHTATRTGLVHLTARWVETDATPAAALYEAISFRLIKSFQRFEIEACFRVLMIKLIGQERRSSITALFNDSVPSGEDLV